MFAKEPSTSTLIRLVELVLILNSFSFNNEYYRQIGGVSMGNGMGPSYDKEELCLPFCWIR